MAAWYAAYILTRSWPPALETVDLFVGEALHQAGETLALPEEVVPVIAAILRGEGLELAIDRIGKCPDQRPLTIAGKEPVPVRAPQ